jgi:hypothetical protein
LTFQAIQSLMRAGVSFHVAAMTDARLMPSEERGSLPYKLRQIGYDGYLEEEMCDPYRIPFVEPNVTGRGCGHRAPYGETKWRFKRQLVVHRWSGCKQQGGRYSDTFQSSRALLQADLTELIVCSNIMIIPTVSSDLNRYRCVSIKLAHSRKPDLTELMVCSSIMLAKRVAA